MSDFRDPELENMLGRLSGAYPDANSAYVAVTGRVRQVKRRRAFVASAAACVALFGVGALAVSGGNGAQNLQPASEASSGSSTESSSVSSAETSVEDTESPSSVDPTLSSTDASSSSEPSSSVSTPSVNSGGGTTTPGKGTTPSSGTSNSGTSNSGTSNSGTSNSGTSNPDTSNSGTSNSGSSQPTVTAPSGNTTYPSDGGSITVSVANGQLSLLSANPLPGFSETIKHDRADRVEVEFSDGSVVWRIRVDLQNGQLVVQTTPN